MKKSYFRKAFPLIFFLLLAASLLQARADNASLESVELHWSVCERSAGDVIKKLSMEVKSEEDFTITFWDRWDEKLSDFINYAQGAILRRRSYADLKQETTIKIRFTEVPALEARWTDLDGFKCEADRYPLRITHACSLSEARTDWSATQREFLQTFVPTAETSDLSAFGPAPAHVWKLRPSHRASSRLRLDLERISLANGDVLLELSTRTKPDEASQLQSETTDWLKKRNLKLCDTQVAKTRQILDSYKNKQFQ